MIAKKSENFQQQNNFRVGDEVIDTITNAVGIVTRINYNCAYYILVHFKDNKGNEQIKSYTKEGKKYESNTNSQLFHYVKDFDYSKVDFDNPPKRQKKFKNYVNNVRYSMKQVFSNF